MKNYRRKFLSFLPTNLEKKLYNKFFILEHKKWEQEGRPLPVSNLSKQEVLREFQKKYSIRTFVETGTYFGDTLYSLSSDFDVLYSIELSEYYYNRAKKRFKNNDRVHLLQGDSGEVLKEVVPKYCCPR